MTAPSGFGGFGAQQAPAEQNQDNQQAPQGGFGAPQGNTQTQQAPQGGFGGGFSAPQGNTQTQNPPQQGGFGAPAGNTQNQGGFQGNLDNGQGNQGNGQEQVHVTAKATAGASGFGSPGASERLNLSALANGNPNKGNPQDPAQGGIVAIAPIEMRDGVPTPKGAKPFADNVLNADVFVASLPPTATAEEQQFLGRLVRDQLIFNSWPANDGKGAIRRNQKWVFGRVAWGDTAKAGNYPLQLHPLNDNDTMILAQMMVAAGVESPEFFVGGIPGFDSPENIQAIAQMKQNMGL